MPHFSNTRRPPHIYSAVPTPILNDTSVPTFMLSALFKTPQVLHCAFANTADSTPGDIARIILSGIVKAAAMVPRDRRCQLIIIIDEIAGMSAKSLEVLFQQCRSLGILIVFSCHSREDIDGPKLKLGSVATRNLAVSIDFSYRTGDDIKAAQAVGGTVIDHTESTKSLFKEWVWRAPVTQGTLLPAVGSTFQRRADFLGVERTRTEYLGERLDVNTLLSVSATKKAAVVTLHTEDEINDYGGLPLYVSLDHHISAEEAEVRANRPLPKGEHTILIPMSRPEDDSGPPQGNGNGAALPPPHTPPPRPVEHINKPKKKKRY